MQVIEGAGRYAAPQGRDPSHWAEQLRVTDLSVGTYSIPAGGHDDQAPHGEDEIYVVTGGSATLVAGGGTAEVSAGDVIYVAAGESHTFTEVSQDLSLLVIFAPAFGSRPA